MIDYRNWRPKIIIELNNWFKEHKRNLPWRETQDPYKIWLSEIILQQTRVAQGLKYYLKFIEHYPTVVHLANASEEMVLKDWQGLGYYSRARNLHKTAKYISNELEGVFPSSYSEIRELKGIGDYTAAAIASFSFGLPYAVIDGNVFRVLSRIFGIEAPIDSTKGKKIFKQLADQLLDQKDPASYNQAIMEFGALQCTPKSPNCGSCPFQEFCYAYNHGIIDILPRKAKKIKQKVRHLNYLIIEDNKNVLVNHRNQKGIWQNLYDFPLIESGKKINKKQLLKTEQFVELFKESNPELLAVSSSRKHILSHQILNAQFFHFKAENIAKFRKRGFQVIPKQKLKELPIPKLIENYLNQETNLLSLLRS